MPNNNYRYPSWYVYDPTPWRENDTEWRTPWDSPYNGALGYDHGDHSDGANEGISKYDIFIGGMLVSWWLLVCFALWISTVRNVRSRTPALEAYSLARRACMPANTTPPRARGLHTVRRRCIRATSNHAGRKRSTSSFNLRPRNGLWT